MTATSMRRFVRFAVVLVPRIAMMTGAIAGCRHGDVRPASPAAIPAAPSELRVGAFDVGYGEAILLSAEDANVLVDTGPAEASERLLRGLQRELRRGLDSSEATPAIDVLILSHPHPDHAGGLEALARSGLRINAVALNSDRRGWQQYATGLEILERKGTRRIDPFECDRSLTVGSDLTLIFSEPGNPDSESDPNNRSLTVLVEWRGRTLFFPGDIVDIGLQESLCAAKGMASVLDVLKLPHHGDTVAPCLAERTATLLLSVGPNPWNLPRAETVQRYAAKLRRTDREGDVMLRLLALMP